MEKRNRHSVRQNSARAESEIPYPAEKRCSKCGTTKPAAAFSKSKREKDGLKSYCGGCGSVMRHAWYLRNAEREIAKTAEWQKANPERKKRIAKHTYFNNHESRRGRAKAAYDRNKEAILATSRAKYATDAAYRAKMVANSNRRCVRKMNAAGSCTVAEWVSILEEYNHCCAYCLRHESIVGKMSMDHMTPLARGGTNDPDNIAPACRPCNSSKNDKTVLEFLAYKAGNMMFA